MSNRISIHVQADYWVDSDVFSDLIAAFSKAAMGSGTELTVAGIDNAGKMNIAEIHKALDEAAKSMDINPSNAWAGVTMWEE